MQVGALIVLIGSALCGLILIVLGRRGRRINDHPQCTWCGFDLHGVYPGVTTCPECGAGLARKHGPKTVRTGVRVRRPIVIAAGVVLVLVPALPLGLISYAAATGSAIAKHLPMGGLEPLTKLGSQTRADEVAAELTDRMVKGTLDASQTARAIELALSYQGDASRPWTRPWADLLERCRLSGLTPAQEKRIVDQALATFSVKLVTRPNVARGSFAPVDIAPGPVRLATDQQVQVNLTIGQWLIDQGGEPLRQPRQAPMAAQPKGVDWVVSRRFNSMTFWILAGPHDTKSRFGFVPDQNREFRTGTMVRNNTPLGPARLMVELELEPSTRAVRGPAPLGALRSAVGLDPRRTPARLLRASTEVLVVATPEEAVEARTLEGAALQMFERAVRPPSIQFAVSEVQEMGGRARVGKGTPDLGAHGGGTRRAISIQVQVGNDQFGQQFRLAKGDNAPAGAAFDMDVLVDNQVLRVGSLPQTWGSMSNGFTSDDSRSATRPFVPVAKRATVRLTPSRALAESLPLTTWFHDGVILIENVPVEVVDFRSQKLEPLEGLKDTTRQDDPNDMWPIPWQR